MEVARRRSKLIVSQAGYPDAGPSGLVASSGSARIRLAMRDAREHEIVAVDLKPPSAPCRGPTISTDAPIPIGAGTGQCRSDLTIADLKRATNYLRLETRSNLTID